MSAMINLRGKNKAITNQFYFCFLPSFTQKSNESGKTKCRRTYPYRPRTSAKMRMRTIPTNTRASRTYARTHCYGKTHVSMAGLSE